MSIVWLFIGIVSLAFQKMRSLLPERRKSRSGADPIHIHIDDGWIDFDTCDVSAGDFGGDFGDCGGGDGGGGGGD